MKRPQALVSYSSSDDSDHEDPTPPVKKKKLPALAASLQHPTPLDNPALHQGRVRTTPHVDGHFAAYIYIPVSIDAGSPLGRLLEEVSRDARELTPGIIDIGILENGKDGEARVRQGDASNETRRELHVSLSRPTYLRAHQREDLKRAIKALAKSHAPFTASFATFSELINDEKTRTFLTLEVGAGHNELRALVEALTPALRKIRQKEFYSDPRFHASIAWALLDSGPAVDLHSAASSAGTMAALSSDPLPPTLAPQEFTRIPHLPPALVPSLTTKYSAQLGRPHVGAFDVGEVKVRIGKWEGGWCMQG